MSCDGPAASGPGHDGTVTSAQQCVRTIWPLVPDLKVKQAGAETLQGGGRRSGSRPKPSEMLWWGLKHTVHPLDLQPGRVGGDPTSLEAL